MDPRKDVAPPDPTVESIQRDLCMDSRKDVVRAIFRHMTMMDHASAKKSGCPILPRIHMKKFLYGSQEGRGAPRSCCGIDTAGFLYEFKEGRDPGDFQTNEDDGS